MLMSHVFKASCPPPPNFDPVNQIDATVRAERWNPDCDPPPIAWDLVIRHVSHIRWERVTDCGFPQSCYTFCYVQHVEVWGFRHDSDPFLRRRNWCIKH